MKLLLDEMYPPAIAEQLRLRGHDVQAVAERFDLRTEPDSTILDTARGEGRAVVTENVPDFQRLARLELASGRSHAGIILASHRRFPRHDRRFIGRIVSALEEMLTSGIDVTDLEIWLQQTMHHGSRLSVLTVAFSTSSSDQGIGIPSPRSHSGNWSA